MREQIIKFLFTDSVAFANRKYMFIYVLNLFVHTELGIKESLTSSLHLKIYWKLQFSLVSDSISHAVSNDVTWFENIERAYCLLRSIFGTSARNTPELDITSHFLFMIILIARALPLPSTNKTKITNCKP